MGIFLVTVSKSKKISTHFQIKRKKERKTGRKEGRQIGKEVGGGGQKQKSHRRYKTGRKSTQSCSGKQETRPRLNPQKHNVASGRISDTSRTLPGRFPDASRTHFGRISDASGKEMKRKEEEEEEEGENEWQFQQLIVLFLFYVIKINMTFLNVFNLKPMFF